MDLLERTFGVRKPVIAMLHLPGLPGRPWHDVPAGMDKAVDIVGRDLAVLQDAGVDGVLFCNEADLPYQLKVGPEIACRHGVRGRPAPARDPRAVRGQPPVGSRSRAWPSPARPARPSSARS